jgi:hypothetical protein
MCKILCAQLSQLQNRSRHERRLSVATSACRPATAAAGRQARGAGAARHSPPGSKRRSDGGVVRFPRQQKPLPATALSLPAGRFSPPWSAPSKKAEGQPQAGSTSLSVSWRVSCSGPGHAVWEAFEDSASAAGVHKGSPWLQLLSNRDPPAAQQAPPPRDVKPQPDPATGASLAPCTMH